MANILIMDDNAEFRIELSEALEKAGYYITSAKSGAEALIRMKDEEFDLLVTDLIVKSHGRTTVDGGISLIGSLRSAELLEQAKPMPIVAITGAYQSLGMESVLDIAQQVGADSVFEKPFAIPDLLAEVARLLDS